MHRYQIIAQNIYIFFQKKKATPFEPPPMGTAGGSECFGLYAAVAVAVAVFCLRVTH
jgi:hypothetical protein